MARKPEVWKVKEEAVAWGFCLGQAGGGFVQASSYWMLSPLGAEVCVRVGEVCTCVVCVCFARASSYRFHFPPLVWPCLGGEGVCGLD